MPIHHRILFLTNLERQLYLWRQAGDALVKEAFPVVCEGKMVSEAAPWGAVWQEKFAAQDIVIFRWMGTGLDCKFLQSASAFLQENRIRHIFLVGDADGDLLRYGLSDEEDKTIHRYFDYGGSGNFRNCLLWLAARFLKSARAYREPELLQWNGIYHPDGEKEYLDLSEYKARFTRGGRPVVGLLFYREEWIMRDLSYQEALVREIERQGMDAVAVFTNGQANVLSGAPGVNAAIEKYFYADGRPAIDVLINTIKFSLTVTKALALKDLEALGVPVLQAYTLFSGRKEWEESAEGMVPMEISVSVSLPEFDGVLHAAPIAAKEDTGKGVSFYQKMEERIGLVTRKARKWANLRRKANGEKRVGIVFHNYPATNSNIGSAAGLDSPESVRLLLAAMRREGYQLDHIPADSKSFMDELLANATNDRRYITDGQIARAERLTGEEYLKFFKRLEDKTRKQLTKDWEDAPGDVFRYDGDLLIPGTLNGNVFITVQPPRGFGEDPGKLLHSPDCAPTHHYIGFYHWLRDIWQADVLLHVGTHGSLEWLPGKGAGMSNGCYPDISIGDMPNVYPYWITIVGEGIQAKRRGAACLISYLTPPMSQSGTYDELAELEKTLDEYCHFKTTQPEELESIEELVREKVKKANLDGDIREEDFACFADYAGKAHAYVTDIKNMQMRTGLHILGRPPEGEDLLEYVLALTRLENGDKPSLRQTLAQAKGFDYYELLENSAARIESTGQTYGALIDELNEKSREIVSLLAQNHFAAAGIEAISRLDWIGAFSSEIREKIRLVAAYVCSEIVPNLRKTTQEISNALSALSGAYVEPGPAGAPTSGGADLLPTGRNFYGVDPRTLPTPSAWKIGVKMGEEVIARYVAEEGRYPEAVGIVLWAGANMRSHGQCIAEFLYLMGLRPVWQRGSLRVIGVEVISLTELKRPRVDVTGRISGLFRDTMPDALLWLDKAVEEIAALEESTEMNYIRKHVQEDAAELEAAGVSAEEARQQASYRIFGDPPGAYGAGIGDLLESKQWETMEDLADVYVRFGGHAYGVKGKGAYCPELFKKRLSSLNVTIKNEDNRESHMLSSDDFNAYHGGMIAAVRAYGGKQPRSYCGDSSDRAKVAMRSLQEETKRLFRAEAINPKFIQGMKKHGYKGAQDLANYVAHSYQWDATSKVMEDWMYEKYAEKYAFDEAVQEWMKEVNPWALQRLTETLLEAEQRGLWNAKPKTREELRKLYLTLEGEIEERSDENMGNSKTRTGI